MLSKRQSDILRILETEGSVSIAALAERLGVSLETVRRDVKPLSEAGTVVRIHGAVGLAGQIGEAPFQKRMRENAAARQAIARAVAEMIRDGDSVMLDTGTTTSYVARELTRRRRLTVVTNSSDIARTLATVNGNRVYMAGGELRKRFRAPPSENRHWTLSAAPRSPTRSSRPARWTRRASWTWTLRKPRSAGYS